MVPTPVQVTGGDPTLRKREELVAIVRRLSHKGMRASLFINGIRAKRELLIELVEAGLVDVAFHVDLTQERRGYESEVALNEIRQDYIERARGLALSVMFNATIFDCNFEEIPAIVQFFVRNCDVVRLASFQLQAETGRGTLGQRSAAITVQSVQEQIEKGARSPISFDTLRVGHACCNRYGMIFVTNNIAYDALDDRELLEAIRKRMPLLSFDRRSRSKIIATFGQGILSSPYLSLKAARWFLRKAWQAKSDLWAARGRVNKLSFIIHNFMDACRLERRVDACAFTAMTQRSPISMCLHNAKRDAFILAPIRLNGPEGERFWNPLSGGSIYLTDSPQRYNRGNRQADVSFEQSDFSAFLFNRANNGASRLSHFIKDKRRGFARYNLAVLKRYVNVEICLVLKVRTLLNAEVWDFVFCAIPNSGIEHFNGANPSFPGDLDIGARGADKGDQRMFTQVAHVIEDIEGVIPSLVWLERSNERQDFRGNILRSTPHAVFKVSHGFAEGEAGLSGADVPSCEPGGLPGGVVEARAEMLNDLRSQYAPPEGKSLSEADFVNFVGAIRVRLNNAGVWLFSEKARDLGFEVVEMFLCAHNP